MSRKKKRNYTSATERAEKRGSGMGPTYLKIPDGMSLFKAKAGMMSLDILPYTVGEGNPHADDGMDHWERTFWIHRGVGANADWIICPRKTAKKNCPVCEHRAKLQQGSDEDNEEMVKDLAPKERQLFIVKNLKDPEKGFQLWDMSFHLFGKQLDARIRSQDEDDEWDKFFFLEDGLTLRVGFVEKSWGGGAYFEAETIDFKNRKRQYDDDVIDDLPCLDDLFIIPTYKALKASFLETDDDDDDDDDKEDDDDDKEDGRTARKRKAKDKSSKSKKKFKRDDRDNGTDDDEDEDDIPMDDDEEDEPEKSSRKKKSKAKDDDDDEDGDWDELDDDDDEDDVDWDDDDKSKKSSKKSRKSSKKKSEPDDDDGGEDEGEDEDWV